MNNNFDTKNTFTLEPTKYEGTMTLNCRGKKTQISVLTAVSISQKIRMYVDTCLESKSPIGEFFMDFSLKEFDALLKKFLPDIEDDLMVYGTGRISWEKFLKNERKVEEKDFKYRIKNYSSQHVATESTRRAFTLATFCITVSFNGRDVDFYVEDNEHTLRLRRISTPTLIYECFAVKFMSRSFGCSIGTLFANQENDVWLKPAFFG